MGASDFSPFPEGAQGDAFPSRHTAVAWALATPFASHYDAPWLYGVAALTNVGRIADREHWLSDTVAGSLLGYGLGRLFYESSLQANKGRPGLPPRSGGQRRARLGTRHRGVRARRMDDRAHRRSGALCQPG